MTRDPAADARMAEAARAYVAERLSLTDHAFVDTTETQICRLDQAWEQLVLLFDEECGFYDQPPIVETVRDIATIETEQ